MQLKIEIPWIPQIAGKPSKKTAILARLRISKEYILQTPKMFEAIDSHYAVKTSIEFNRKNLNKKLSLGHFIIGRPDLMYAANLIIDAAIGYIITDRRQVSGVYIEKKYADKERTIIKFEVSENYDERNENS